MGRLDKFYNKRVRYVDYSGNIYIGNVTRCNNGFLTIDLDDGKWISASSNGVTIIED